jgi:hypothetical protein
MPAFESLIPALCFSVSQFHTQRTFFFFLNCFRLLGKVGLVPLWVLIRLWPNQRSESNGVGVITHACQLLSL